MSEGNGHDTDRDARPYQLTYVLDLLEPGVAPAFIVDGLIEAKSVVGLVAPPEAGKSLLMQEMALCVALGVPFHGRATRRGLVVYLAGEGQHGLRARFQALHTRYEREMDEKVVPLELAMQSTPLIDPAESIRVLASIQAAEEEHELPLTLLVIDTLARFISPGDESKAQDMGAYLNAIDLLRGDAAAVSLHHPGHGDATRGRGSSSFKAGLDAEYSIANADGVLTVSCQKMKDGQKPSPFSFRVESAPTKMVREDGTALMSALLHPTETAVIRRKPTGKHQKSLLAHLESIKEGPGVWQETELRDLARGIGMNRFQARDAVLGLRQLGYLTATIGGSRLAAQF
jgi:AAA domain